MQKSVVLAFILFTCSLSEAISLTSYMKNRGSRDKNVQYTLITYIAGLGDGLLYANEAIKSKHGTPLFCQPSHLSFYPQHFKDILDRSIERMKDDEIIKKNRDEKILGLILLYGLQDTYPCNEKKQ